MQFNRPVLLQLAATGGRRVPVLMRSITDNLATVEIDGSEFQVSRADIQRFWFGDYQLLWQLPPGRHTVLRPGNRSGDVIWLEEQLQIALELSSAKIGSRFYSQELKTLVEQFQLTQGLNADGVAGPETIIYLNTATKRPGVPMLQTPRTGNVAAAGLPGNQ